MSLKIIKSSSLTTLPPLQTSLSYTTKSVAKTTLALMGVGVISVLEALATLAALQYVADIAFPGASNDSKEKLKMGVFAYSLVSSLASPWLLRMTNRAYGDSRRDEVDKMWDNARPMKDIRSGFMKGGQALSWGVSGKMFFAPAMFKMSWSGKTIRTAADVSMLEFEAINNIPTPKFNLNPVASATLMNGEIDGKTSMALAYNYLPIVDYLRRLDSQTVIGKMMIGNVKVLYFTLKCKE
jgi:hypothetical protein